MAHPTHRLPEPDSSLVSAAPIRILLVISSKLERLGWSIVLENQDDMQVHGQFAEFDEALARLTADSIDVVLIDEVLLTPKHCEALRSAVMRHKSRVLLVTKHPLDEGLERTRYSFVSDFLLKGISAADLLAAIRGPR
ncbi:MAG: hypothetical protein WCC14_17875 [Acidobacteriaceae bacterium]